MNDLLKAVLLVATIFLGSAFIMTRFHQDATLERNYFQFAISKYKTQRQGGQTVSIYVKFSYKNGLEPTKYVDYRLMRTQVLRYIEPSKELPADTYWEIIAAKMGSLLMHDYPLDGVSVQIESLDNTNPNTFEPGDHGPVFTIGNIEPLDIPPTSSLGCYAH